MKTLFATLAIGFAGSVMAAYEGDVVKYWATQTSLLVNGTIIGNLQSPPSAWGPAIVFGSIYLAATETQSKSLAYQQLAISHAAHNTLVWFFHGTRNYAATSAALKRVLSDIGLSPNSTDAKEAKEAGKEAAKTVILKRSDDGNNDFVDYVVQPPAPGVYQNTSGGATLPDVPHARYIKLFGGVGEVAQFEVPPPPSPHSLEYEEHIDRVKAVGERNSTTRTAYETETAYYWRESSITFWTRVAHAVVGDKLKEDVVGSAKFYAQFYYALANAGIASWHIKYRDNAWRPITAIHYPDIYLPSNRSITAPNWTPLLAPTPSHPDYTSTHATFGGAAAQVITKFNGGETVDVTISSNVTVDGVGVVTRRYTNLTFANWENGESRVLGGIHFAFASEEGDRLGREVALKTLERFDGGWRQF